jgi:hypothetical protein
MAQTPYLISTAELTVNERLNNVETLLRLLLLSAHGSLPVTGVATSVTGAAIDPISPNAYANLYTNNYLQLLALKVNAEFTGAGQSISLSLTNDPSNLGRVDILSSGGKLTSDVIWLKPDSTLYIRSIGANPLGASTFRPLLFDPLSFSQRLGAGI